MPSTVFSVVDFPEAFPPRRRTSSPSPTTRSTSWRMSISPVVGVDAVEPEERLRGPSWRSLLPPSHRCRGTPRRHAGSLATSSNVPSAIFSPWSSATTRSEIPSDDVHVVLDEDERIVYPPSSRSFAMSSRDLVRLHGVHAGCGLVEEEDARPRRGRAGDLEPAPVRVREAVRGLVPAIAHEPLAEEGELLLSEGVHGGDGGEHDHRLLARLPSARHEEEERVHDRRGMRQDQRALAHVVQEEGREGQQGATRG